MSLFYERRKAVAEKWYLAKSHELKMKEAKNIAIDKYALAIKQTDLLSCDLKEFVNGDQTRLCFKVTGGVVLVLHNYPGNPTVVLEKLL